MNDELMHYGILGMKWGVRRYQDKDGSLTNAGEKRYNSTSFNKENKWGIKSDRLKLTTKSGDSIELKDQPSSAMSKFLAKHIKSVAREQEKTAVYDIKDSSGKNVGDITLYKETKDSVNVVWVTTNESVRGRGYGTAVMKAAIDIAKDTGAKKVTLEVPGNSPDARHIYEKLGFKEVASPDRDEDDVWGGLTNMELNLNSLKHSFSTESNGLIPVSLEEKRKYGKFLKREIDSLSDSSKSSELYHYGVLGMKWGVRRQRKDSGSSARSKQAHKSKPKNYSEDYREYKKLRAKDHRTLSNAELQKVNNRMNLELNYEKMTRTELSRGKDAAQVVLGYAGLVTSAYALYKSPVGDAIRGMIESRRS